MVVDDAGTPGNPADDFVPTFTGGDTNGNGLLDVGETWTYTATQTAASMGQYTNIGTVTGTSPTGMPVMSQSPSNHFIECPMVMNVVRFGVHMQPTQIVVTFSGPLTQSQAENLANYQLFGLSPNGRFTLRIPLVSAVYNPATNSVTLTTVHGINVHHLFLLNVTNPCPGGPNFSGILNRKFSLGAIVLHNGRVIHLPPTDVPGVLNPAALPKVLTAANRRAVLRLTRSPASGAFASVSMSRAADRPNHPKVTRSASVPKGPLRGWANFRTVLSS